MTGDAHQTFPKGGSKLDRAIAKIAARRQDEQQLRAWARAVKARDGWRDRRTGQPVRGTRELDPRRAEAHHIEGKSDRAVRYDVRNGICLSFETHFLVETGVYVIEGTAWFTIRGCRYIDATAPVIFVRT